MRTNQALIAILQEKIDNIAGAFTRQTDRLPFGVPEIDDRIPGGLAFGSTHETAGGGSDAIDGAASALFAAGIAARAKGPVFWCFVREDLFPPGLVQVGPDTNRATFIGSDDDTEVLDSAEEIIRHGGVAVCVAETVRLPMVASRRLQLAAEKTGTMGLIVRRWRRQSDATDYGMPSASMTRWRISVRPSEPLPVTGVGRRRWHVELMRARSGDCFDIEVGACDEHGQMEAVLNESDARRIAQRPCHGCAISAAKRSTWTAGAATATAFTTGRPWSRSSVPRWSLWKFGAGYRLVVSLPPRGNVRPRSPACCRRTS